METGERHQVQIDLGQLGEFRHAGLEDKGDDLGVGAHGEVVEEHLAHRASHERGLLGVIGQRL